MDIKINQLSEEEFNEHTRKIRYEVQKMLLKERNEKRALEQEFKDIEVIKKVIKEMKDGNELKLPLQVILNKKAKDAFYKKRAIFAVEVGRNNISLINDISLNIK